jgi:phosphoribosyl-ATP pyrophosphohydrolase
MFILCQTPDPIDGEYSTIAELCKERMRRAGKKVLEEAKHKCIDIGFQVWKVRKKGDTNE